jgi:hypothetical protein
MNPPALVRALTTLSPTQIARELTELQALAATGGFTEEHFAGATFR